MLGVGRKRAAAVGCSVHLPFADGALDGVLRFGNLNRFGDEGMSEARRATWLGRRMVGTKTLYRFRTPFRLLPGGRIENVELPWVWREVFWLLRFEVAGGAGPPDEGEVLRQKLEAPQRGSGSPASSAGLELAPGVTVCAP